MCMFFNKCIDQGKSLFLLKHANIALVFKKGYRGSKDNWRPVSILPIISKIFEKLLCRLITVFMDKFPFNYQCEFCKGFSTQHCLHGILKKRRRSADQGQSIGWAFKRPVENIFLPFLWANFFEPKCSWIFVVGAETSQ